MVTPEIVIDTNVLIAALRSRRGASYKLLTLIGSGRFEINVSVPLILEYETVAKRLVGETELSEDDIDDMRGVNQAIYADRGRPEVGEAQ